jgi:hypothetical protein
MTGRARTLPWWLGGVGGKDDRKQTLDPFVTRQKDHKDAVAVAVQLYVACILAKTQGPKVNIGNNTSKKQGSKC